MTIAVDCDVKHQLKQTKLIKGPANRGPKEIDGLLVPPGTAYTLLTDHLITG